MTQQRRVGILGGTFDPIHLGHLGAAEAARSALLLEEVLVVPSHVPPHRQAQPDASGYHRFAMVALAVGPAPGLVASDMELVREGRSYTATTLSGLHARGFRPSQLFFIIGADAFAEIATWHEYPAVLDLSHFVVIARPGFPLEMLRWQLPMLASRMRTIAGAGENQADLEARDRTLVFLVEASTPEVSSTQIRERIRGAQPLAGLVSPAVELHIYRHGLYAPRGGASVHEPDSHAHGHT
jgi:nicotinate-nucleotide adenylyltransferase